MIWTLRFLYTHQYGMYCVVNEIMTSDSRKCCVRVRICGTQQGMEAVLGLRYKLCMIHHKAHLYLWGQHVIVLRKYDANDDDTTRKQKFIGIRKCDSEASMSHNNATKDLEGSTKDVSSRNIQRTKYSKNIDDEGHGRRKNDHNKQRGGKSVVVEPRSYRDVVVNGNVMRQG